MHNSKKKQMKIQRKKFCKLTDSWTYLLSSKRLIGKVCQIEANEIFICFQPEFINEKYDFYQFRSIKKGSAAFGAPRAARDIVNILRSCLATSNKIASLAHPEDFINNQHKTIDLIKLLFKVSATES